MTNDTISGQKTGIISPIYNFLFFPTESQDVKLLKKNTAILMHNKKSTTIIHKNKHSNK